jgi:hypothetical protein
MENPDDELIKEFVERYKGILPNPINYPNVIQYYWKIFQYSKGSEKNG